MLAVASHDVDRARTTLETSWMAHLDEAEREAASIVIDFGADEMTCPACLTSFATGPRECPDCGLFLG